MSAREVKIDLQASIGTVRLRTINTWLMRVGLVLVVSTDDTRETGSTELHLMRASVYPGAS